MSMIRNFGLASTAVLALAACQPMGTQGEYTRAQQGAVTGAVIGAAAGAMQKDNKLDKALAGALIGGAVGGVVGSQLDQQAAALQTAVNNPNVTVVNNGKSVVMTMPQDVTFAVDSANVRPDLQVSLANVAATLNRYPNSTISVVGHTDNTGAAAYNQQLSEQRARAVANVLTGNGVNPNRISAVGRGEDQPVASNLNAQGRAQNRRVEIIVTPTR
ncbi:OmpA family protein [Paracoccus sp. p4-l81]|uniref:OmpA family protein n=1 Tax=unclassified Paracoccus (in: a-proteobacteria) TaxID=2688777 RepID=UPI0035B9B85A